MDEINSALDQIEQQNDTLHAQLLELLQDNRQIREQLQQNNKTGNNTTNDANVEDKK